jgi:hypothetical protein
MNLFRRFLVGNLLRGGAARGKASTDTGKRGNTSIRNFRFQGLTAVKMWTAVFWVVMPCRRFYNEEGGDMFLRNVGNYLQDYRAP